MSCRCRSIERGYRIYAVNMFALYLTDSRLYAFKVESIQVKSRKKALVVLFPSLIAEAAIGPLLTGPRERGVEFLAQSNPFLFLFFPCFILHNDIHKQA